MASTYERSDLDKLNLLKWHSKSRIGRRETLRWGVQLSPISHCFATRLVPDLVTSERLFNYSVFVEWMLSAHGYQCKDSITGKSLICHVETFVVSGGLFQDVGECLLESMLLCAIRCVWSLQITSTSIVVEVVYQKRRLFKPNSRWALWVNSWKAIMHCLVYKFSKTFLACGRSAT